MQMRTVHRVVSIVVVLFTLYLGLTGSLIELIDLRTMATVSSPFDPNLRAMREDFAGPPNFEVLQSGDHQGQPLPVGADLGAMLRTVVTGARATLGAAPLKFVELRMADGRPVGQVERGDRKLRFDAATGRSLGAPPPTVDDLERGPPASQRNTIKHLHRMTTFGDWALWINIGVSLALATLIVTGFVVFYRIWAMRRKMGRTNPFWTAGGWWRALHRSISVAAILFLTVTTLSGAWLAVESLVFGLYMSHHHVVLPSGQTLPGTLAIDASSPLRDAELPGMLQATLTAYHADDPTGRPRVIRLRHYAAYDQGVVITDGSTARQLVFNTRTGTRMSLSEPGYPGTGFPFGWQAHQYAKSIHRGDFFGLTGRLTSLIAGLSMVYLSISGIVMYWTMWQKRRRTNRPAFFWK